MAFSKTDFARLANGRIVGGFGQSNNSKRHPHRRRPHMTHIIYAVVQHLEQTIEATQIQKVM